MFEYFQFDFSHFPTLTLAQLNVALWLLCMGIVVYLHNRTSWVNRVFLFLTIPVSLWLIGFAFGYLSKTGEQAYFWFKFGYNGVILISLITYCFSVIYTQSYKQTPLVMIGGIIAIFWYLLLYSNHPGFLNGLYQYSWGFYPRGGNLYWLFLVFFLPYAALLGYNFITWYRKTNIPTEKQVTLLLSIAFLFAYAGIIDFLPTFGIDLFKTRQIGFIPVAIWIILVGYTILQYRVWNVRFIAHQTLYYFSLSAVILLGYGFVFWIFLKATKEVVETKILIFNSVLFLILSFFLGTLREKTQIFVNRVFYRQKIDYRRIIDQLKTDLNSLLDFKILVQTVFITFHKNLLIEHFSLLIYNEEEEPQFKPVITTLTKQETRLSIPWSFAKDLFYKLEKFNKDIGKDEVNTYPLYKKVAKKATELFDLYNAELLIPIVRRRKLLGFLLLGGQKNKKIYDPDLRQKFLEFSSVFGVALENTQLYQEVRTVSEMKSDIIMIVSHQLRTPITSMRWGLSLMLKGLYGELTLEQKELLQQVYQNTLETGELISRLLNLSRLERGKLSFEPIPFDLVALINTSIFQMSAIAKNKDITIVFKCLIKKITIYADQDRLQEVLQIILDNAIKYSSGNKQIIVALNKTWFTESGRFYGEATRVVEGVKISITDYGIGISVDDQKKLFSKFFRGKNAAKFETSGLGIGLAYAKSIIDLHGGKIELKSKLNIGTTISIHLPVKRES